MAASIRHFLSALALLPAALAAPRAEAAVYEALPGESALTYRIRHPMRTVEGVSKDFVCRVDLAPDTVSSHVVVSADVRSFKSGNSFRDRHAASVIHADQHPQVHFASDSVRSAGGAFRVYGRLTFAGRTRPVDFLVMHEAVNGKVRVSGSFSILLPDYGVEPPSLMTMATEDRLDIRFDVVARDDWAPGSAEHPWNPLPHAQPLPP